MRILTVASEAFGLAKTGGLADVTSALTQTLVQRGHDVRLLLPAYRGLAAAASAKPAIDLGDPLGAGRTSLLKGRLPGTAVEVWLVDNPRLFDRAGGPYLDPDGVDWADNHLRFATLSRAAAMMAIAGATLGWIPDVVHAHDWQAGLVPAYLAWWGGRRPATVFTVHNLHFSGAFAPSVLPQVGLPDAAYSMYGVELYGSVSFLKAGLFYADRLTTVSPGYAEEIQTPLGGEGLDGLLRGRAGVLDGIVNGIDTRVWNPERDAHLAIKYSASTLQDKARLKEHLQTELGLDPRPDAPLFGLVGRLTHQKGIDLVLGALPVLLARGGQLAVLGSGESALEASLREAAAHNPGRVAFREGYDEPLSHRCIAGSDLLLVPSRFEPCGLTQMYAMIYGTPPIVRRTGGLADTVCDCDDVADGEGFMFAGADTTDLAGAIARATDAFAHRPRFEKLQRCGMQRDFGWDKPASAYEHVYAAAVDDVASRWRPKRVRKTEAAAPKPPAAAD